MAERRLPQMRSIKLGSELTEDELRQRQAEGIEAVKGFAVGVPSGLVGLPADLLALVAKDAPEIYSALVEGRPLNENEKGLLYRAAESFQDVAGAEAIARGMGFGENLDAEATGEDSASQAGANAFRQGMLVGEFGADPVLIAKGLGKLFGKTFKGETRTEVLEPEAPVVSPLEDALQSFGPTINTPGGPVVRPTQEVVEAPTPDLEPVSEGIGTLTPIRTEEQQALRAGAFPAFEDGSSLPNQPVNLLPTQGRMADYSPVYRQLSALDENETYTAEGVEALLKALPEEAHRDLYNFPSIKVEGQRDYERRAGFPILLSQFEKPHEFTKDELLDIYNRTMPSVAVNTVKKSEADSILKGQASYENMNKSLAEQVDRLGNAQNPFDFDNPSSDPSVMVFSNPTTGVLGGVKLSGVPGHDYFNGVPGYFAHVRYDDVVREDGKKFAGFIEAQSNAQNALRLDSEDALRVDGEGIDIAEPSLSYAISTFLDDAFEPNYFPELKQLQDATGQKHKEFLEAIRSFENSSINYSVKVQEDLTSNTHRVARTAVEQPPERFGSQGSMVKVLGDAADELLRIQQDEMTGSFAGIEDVRQYEDTMFLEESRSYEESVFDIIDTIANDFRKRQGGIYDTTIDEMTDVVTSPSDNLDFTGLGQVLNALAFAKAKPNVDVRQVIRGSRPDIMSTDFGNGLNTREVDQLLRDSAGNLKKQGISREKIDEFLETPEMADPFYSGVTYNQLYNFFGREGADAVVLNMMEKGGIRDLVNFSEMQKLEIELSKPENLPTYLSAIMTEGNDGSIVEPLIELLENSPMFAENVARYRMTTIGSDPSSTAAQRMEKLEQTIPVLRAMSPERLSAFSNTSAVGNEFLELRGQLFDKYNKFLPEGEKLEPPMNSDSYFPTLDQRDFGEKLDELIAKELATGEYVVTPEYNETDIANILRKMFTSDQAPLLVPTPFANAAQSAEYMYKQFFVEAMKKGYDGVVFPGWKTQADAHQMEPDLAKRIYGKTLKGVLKKLKKDYPDFPLPEEEEFLMKISGGSSSPLRGATTVEFTPEMKEFFLGTGNAPRVMRRAKGGPVDLRPKKMIHSGIGAMAREVM